MFRGVLDSVKNAASNLVAKYLARASVALPFMLAVGFALAGATVTLAQRFGSLTAYWAMAGLSCLAGVVAAVFVSAKERNEEAAEKAAEKTDTSSTVSDATAAAMAQAPIALLGSIFSIPGGAATVLSAARVVGRNWPMAALLLFIGGLIWPMANRVPECDPAGRFRANGRDPERSGMTH